MAFDMTLAFMAPPQARSDTHGRPAAPRLTSGRITATYGTFQDIIALSCAQEEARRAREQLHERNRGAARRIRPVRVPMIGLSPSTSSIASFIRTWARTSGAGRGSRIFCPPISGTWPFSQCVPGVRKHGSPNASQPTGRATRSSSSHCKTGRGSGFIENETSDWRARRHACRYHRLETSGANGSPCIIAGTNVGTWEWDMVTGTMSYNERLGRDYRIQPRGDTAGRRSNSGAGRHIPQDYARAKARLEAHFRGETEFYEAEVRIAPQGRSLGLGARPRTASPRATRTANALRMSGTHLDITGTQAGGDCSLGEPRTPAGDTGRHSRPAVRARSRGTFPELSCGPGSPRSPWRIDDFIGRRIE